MVVVHEFTLILLLFALAAIVVVLVDEDPAAVPLDKLRGRQLIDGYFVRLIAPLVDVALILVGGNRGGGVVAPPPQIHLPLGVLECQEERQ